jgi:DNA-binding response OmpR family regulator
MPDSMLESKKILIVEDDSDLREMYVEVLNEAGFEVDQAPDGEVAFAKMTLGGYDIVLLDIMLPKLDGLTILEKLKETPPQKTIGSIVVLSNLGQDTAIAKAIVNGARAYMIKSDYTPGQVVEMVKNYLTTPA